ncbi:MAG TPA: RimK family alpha-L-glutamate ligase [Polyangiaceae bacterium]
MRIAILSSSIGSYSTRRLREACTRRAHEAMVLSTLRFSLLVGVGQGGLFFRDQPLRKYDAVIPRIGASLSTFGTAVLRQFECSGVFALNGSEAVSRARDKLWAMQLLSRAGVAVPPTAFTRDREGVAESIARVGGAPLILKLLTGTQGLGVVLAETMQAATAVVDMLHSVQEHVLIQRFVRESGGRDVRAFVVGERVVAAIERRAADGEFRANLHRGARASRVVLDPEFERAAVRASQALGLQVSGVDLVQGPEGPLVIDVNASPGLEGVETVTGIDVAGAIIEYLERQFTLR